MNPKNNLKLLVETKKIDNRPMIGRINESRSVLSSSLCTFRINEISKNKQSFLYDKLF